MQAAIASAQAVVALESTVMTHGLPRPQNLELARSLEAVIRSADAVPATIGVVRGELVIGLTSEEMEELANHDAEKASLWNLAALCAGGKHAGTTVATTLHGAALAGIRVFATGGIGGVHSEPYDESADLIALSRHPIVTVCAGPKSILDVRATLERLESLGVPIVGYQSDLLAGFHVPLTAHSIPNRADSPEAIARILNTQIELELRQGILVSNPVSEGLDEGRLSEWINEAYTRAYARGKRGKDITPFLLSELAELSNGETVTVNLRLLQENAQLAAAIARALVSAPQGAGDSE